MQSAPSLCLHTNLWSEAIEWQRVGGNLNPNSIKEISIPVELQLTERGDQFLAFDSGPDDENRVLIFATETNLDTLETSPEWHADGTFKTSPLLFYQLYSIHAVYNDHTVPLVYILLTNKNTSVYKKAFSALKDLNPDLSPVRIVTDFELAAIIAFQDLFPSVDIKGCFFHFSQAVWRKVQEMGLANLYKENDELRKTVKCLVALALIPPEDVLLGFEKIIETLPPDTALTPLLEYFESTWLGSSGRLGRRSKALFDKSIWNQFEKAASGCQKTNNSVEGWHRAFQHGMGFAHPTLGKFLSFLRREQNWTEVKMARIQGGEPPNRDAKYVKSNEHVMNILANYQNNRVLNLLQGLANNFDF